MSFDGQVLCHRQLIAPWALTTLGAAIAGTAALAAAIFRKLRRVAGAVPRFVGMSLLPCVPGIALWRRSIFAIAHPQDCTLGVSRHWAPGARIRAVAARAPRRQW